LARNEGILTALETCHALAKAAQIAKTMTRDQHLVICLSGRGDKDAAELARLRGQEW
jgi:tryptophan synthase beta chain